jgi:hypothetical protein
MSNYSLSNITFTASSNFISPLVSIPLGTLASAGWLGSLIILLLSLFSNNLKDEFKYFIGNVALVGLITETTWLGYLICSQVYPVQNVPSNVTVVIQSAIFLFLLDFNYDSYSEYCKPLSSVFVCKW